MDDYLAGWMAKRTDKHACMQECFAPQIQILARFNFYSVFPSLVLTHRNTLQDTKRKIEKLNKNKIEPHEMPPSMYE